MNSGKYVFRQLLGCFNRYEFEKCVRRYRGDYRTREFNCWNQFAQLFFGQLTARNGLRDICTCLKAHSDKLYHLGIRQNVSHSALSRANEKRDWQIFAEFGTYMIGLVRPLYANAKVSVDVGNEIFVLDSTTISLSITLWSWARGKYSRGAVKVHTMMDLRGNIPVFVHITDGRCHDVNALDEITICREAIYVMDKAYVDFGRLYRIEQAEAFFVVRAKEGLDYRVVISSPVDAATGLLADQKIVLCGPKSKRLYPENLRRIEYYVLEKDITLTFLTNNFEADALQIAQIYRNRWKIELFFKWIKHNLQIKTIWGHSQNAVCIHIWVAVCTYLLVAWLKAQLKTTLSIYEMMQVLSISAFDKTPINQLLTKPLSNQNVKELPKLF